MTRGGDKAYAITSDIVVWISERLCLQFAAIAGTGIHITYCEAATETRSDRAMKFQTTCLQCGDINSRRILGNNANPQYLMQNAQHYKSTPE